MTPTLSAAGVAPAWDERLWVPWWGWLVALALALLAALTVHSGAPGWRAVLPYLVAPLLAVAVTGWASRGRVRVEGGMLHVPGARLPLTCVGGVLALDAESTRRLRGPAASPVAFVATRPWLRQAVRIAVADALDDTPYWLVGSRHPEQLAAVLVRERG